MPIFAKISHLSSFHQKLLLGLFLTLTFFTSISLTYFIFSHPTTKAFSPLSGQSQIAGLTTPEVQTPAKLPQDTFNILLLGHGDAGHDGGNLTDSITLLHLNLKTKLAALISIPRDLWVPLENQPAKINSYFPMDPDQAGFAKQAVLAVTGLTPHYFVSVDFFGLTAIVDELDGIDISLDQAAHDDFYPVRGRELELCGMTPKEIQQVHEKYTGFELEKQFKCRYETIHYDAGTHHVNGDSALKLARSRHGSSDFERSARQQAILLGIKDGLLSLNALQKAPDIYNQLRHTFHTDIDLDLASNIAAAMPDFPDYTLKRINLSTDNVLTQSKSSAGAFILLPKNNDFQSLHQYINQQLAK